MSWSRLRKYEESRVKKNKKIRKWYLCRWTSFITNKLCIWVWNMKSYFHEGIFLQWNKLHKSRICLKSCKVCKIEVLCYWLWIRNIVQDKLQTYQTSFAPVVSSTWNSNMTSFFPWSCVCATSAKDTSNACLEPTRNVSMFPAKTEHTEMRLKNPDMVT